MISDARGGHVSPGIYTEEKDVTYSVKSLGITSLGLVGETVKGPAFQPVPIKDWSEFVDYFGGTSPEKFKGTGLPKYELPYIAESYLKDSKQLNVVRVLGFSGYKAGDAHVVYANNQPVVILRSKGDYSGEVSGGCDASKVEKFTPYVTSVSISGYTKKLYDAHCSISSSAITIPLVQYVKNGKLWNSNAADAVEANCFQLVVKYKTTESGATEQTVSYNVSLNPTDRDYIYNVLSSDPNKGNSMVWIESVYDYALQEMINSKKDGDTVEFTYSVNTENNSFEEVYRCGQTPWIVSEVKGASSAELNLKKLFKFYTISDGNASNYQVKVSIEKVRPDEGLFDVVIRDFYDTDAAPVVLEKFSNLSMVEGTTNYIGYKIGTYDGGFEAKSKYVTVMIAEGDGIESCVPCGFLGYPIPKYGATDRLPMAYNTKLDSSIKTKRQYFGLNSKVLDVDVLNYKGVAAYNNGLADADTTKVSNGFHLDAIIKEESGATVYVDGVSGFTFTTVDSVNGEYTKLPRIVTEAYAKNSIYEDINARKFTVYPYGGFDGWDIYRNYRTNTDKFKATKYPIISGCPFYQFGDTEMGILPDFDFNLPANAITTDYYAYLAGYKQFANPQDVAINIFATPGIDFANQPLLIEDALDVVEDKEDGRGGDALHVMTAPKVKFGEGTDGMAYEGYTLTADEVVAYLEDSDIDSSYACTYWPWIQFYDKANNTYIDLPTTKDVVRNMAYTDNNSYPWFAPAGMERGSITCVKPCVKTTLAIEDELYGNRINPIKKFASDGVKAWGNKTLYSLETPTNRINARRLMLRVKKLVVDASQSLIFDQYDVNLDKQFKSLVEPILADVKSNRGLHDYKVVTESTTETRDQHILPAKICVKPVGALEYISISFIVTPESVKFED